MYFLSYLSPTLNTIMYSSAFWIPDFHHTEVTHIYITSRVTCLDCGAKTRRADLQEAIRQLNPDWHVSPEIAAPDGDALISNDLIKDFSVPDCQNCGGVLKPDVVFFGDSVPRDTVSFVHKRLRESDAVLILGSSIQVYSAYRFIVAAHELKLPLAIVNIGATRADDMATLRLHSKIGDIVNALNASLPS